MNAIAQSNAPSQDSRNIAVLVYLLTIFFSFIPGLVIFILKKEDEFIFDAGKEALNWSITLMLASLILGWIPILGWMMLGVLWVCNIVCSILGALNASKGLFYRYPFTLRLIA
ncbi:DUF4870 domain-containing protein [Chitinibacter bivalviorum]|uniref:DUF4870 domain-containing protein n=1 Tax=Chitinibacter bivalviorum TaxID=2739434 RepID=A0A7H9BEZ5_9NEIS|nr:DUF4870 domain-containing protein [Chitinibacter bivalviorum]QLG87189.1 DUF4870 domain-containing protein [Chitinibacter bivalviorum]